jgi:hypothetical protein
MAQPRFRTTCMACGRGVGADGAVLETEHPPTRLLLDCPFCDGYRQVLQVPPLWLDRLMREVATYDERPDPEDAA